MIETNKYIESKIFIAKLNKREEFAFKTLFDYYYRQLCYFSDKIVEDQDTAKDIVQDVFISVWNTKLSFETIHSIKSYLYSSVKNNSLSHISKIKNREKINHSLDFELETNNTFITQQLEAEIIQEIFDAINELPDQCGNVFKMSYIKKYENSQIAQELNISINRVKTHKLRAKKYLKERLKNIYPILIYLFFN